MYLNTDGLIAYYNSKKGVIGSTWENIAPDTKGQYNGTLNGTTVNANGMNFNSANSSYVQFNDAMGLYGADSFTFEVFLNISNSDADSPRIYDQPNNISYSLASGQHIIRVGGKFKSYFSATNQPVHVAFAYNSTIKYGILYINGVYSNTYDYGTVLFGLFKNEPWRLGSYLGTNSPNGVIDNIRFYNRQLNAEEIANNYNIGREVGLPAQKIGSCFANGLTLPIYDPEQQMDNKNQLRISTPKGNGCFNLVDVTDPLATPFRVSTSTGVKAIATE